MDSILSSINPDLFNFIRKIYGIRYETYSRFLDSAPHFLQPEEALKHIDQGKGLSCAEKVRLLAYWLTNQGIKNQIITGGFEIWHEGKCLTKFKGDLTKPPNEKFILQFFDPKWTTSSYETPSHISHYANYFEINGEKFLTDTTGEITTFKLFSGDEVYKLLDAKNKSYLDYLPWKARIYYHRISEDLLQKIYLKQTELPSYILGNFLATALITGSRSFVNLKWWWKEETFKRDEKMLVEFSNRISQGNATCVITEDIDEFIDLCKDDIPEQDLMSLRKVWPTIQHWIGHIFDSPRYLRLAITKSKLPLKNYSSNTLRQQD